MPKPTKSSYAAGRFMKNMSSRPRPFVLVHPVRPASPSRPKKSSFASGNFSTSMSGAPSASKRVRRSR